MPEYTLSGIPVQFPYNAYDCQLVYMSKVIEALKEKKNAVLESPTGTGKTLCLLCATLAWQQSLRLKDQGTSKASAEKGKVEGGGAGEVEIYAGKHKNWVEALTEAMSNREGLPTIVYSSRTHSQLAQVMGELKNTGYRPKTAVLGSRQQLCLHPNVNQLPNSAANHACRALVKAKSCSWHNKTEYFVRKNPTMNSSALDIEELAQAGSDEGICPFYLARHLTTTAELVFMPYNYLVDPRLRASFEKMIRLENSVLIFDEAHNIESVCCDSCSFDLPAPLLASCIKEADEAYVAAVRCQESGKGTLDQDGEGLNYFQIATEMKIVHGMLKALEDEIAGVDCSSEQGSSHPGTFLLQLCQKAMKINGDEDLWQVIQKMELAVNLLDDEGEQAGRRQRGQRLTLLAEGFRLLAESLQPLQEGKPPPVANYRVNVRMEKTAVSGKLAPTLHYWCFTPGLAMQCLSRQHVRSFLLTSGTLSPLNTFAEELHLPFPITLENPHVINTSQVWIGVVGVGPKGVTLNSSYANRDSEAYKEDMGSALVNFARIVPDGLLVFFPSYSVLQSCIDFWQTNPRGSGSITTWDRICKLKQPVIEPRESTLFGSATEDYGKKLQDPSTQGAIFFAVCRGKVSEGLDFADKAGRAVVITGIPFANIKDAKVGLKQEVLNEAAKGTSKSRSQVSLTGDRWYKQQALRAVNQAMGRVIRHRQDHGAIILCDNRFAQPVNMNQLSAWLRALVQVHQSFGTANSSLTRFFKQHRAAAVSAPPPVPTKKATWMPQAAASTNSTHPSNVVSQKQQLQIPRATDASGLFRMPNSKRKVESAQGLLSALQAAADEADGTGACATTCREQATSDCSEDVLAALQASKPAFGRRSGLLQTKKKEAIRVPPVMERHTASAPVNSEAPGKTEIVQAGPTNATAKAAKQRSAVTNVISKACEFERSPRKQKSMSSALLAAGKQQNLGAETGSRGTGALENSEGLKEKAQQIQSEVGARGDTKEYLKQLKRELPLDAFKQITNGLKDLRQGKIKNREVYQVVLEVLFVPGRRHLLNPFKEFVSKADREWFSNCIRSLMETNSVPTSSRGQSTSGGVVDRKRAVEQLEGEVPQPPPKSQQTGGRRDHAGGS